MPLPRPMLALSAALLLTGGAASSSVAAGGGSPVGVWLTSDDHGQIEVFSCGGRLCGMGCEGHNKDKSER